MTLYLDTSSLVKLYVEEPDSDEVRQSLSSVDIAATSHVAYAEARAAFARRFAERGLTRRELALIKDDFDRDWPSYMAVEVTAALCRSAGDVAERYRLRGFDAIHLASFMEVASTMWPDAVEFYSFDRRLNRAAASALRSIRRGRSRR